MDVKTPDPIMTTAVFPTTGEHFKVTDPSEDLEYQSSFVASARRCRDIGWRLAAVDARELVELAVDFEEPAEHWLQQCLEAGSLLGRVNLGVHTGSASGLVILEVGNGEGKSALDHYGSWRSPCQARMNGREQHYYTLPAGVIPPPTRFLMASRVMLFGEGGLAPLPPSVDVQSQNVWRWVNPPWEYLPPELPSGLRNFVKQLIGPSPEPETKDDILPWEEVYRLITSHKPLLNALLAPYPSLEAYYDDLLKIALASGLHDQGLLLGLLWHAPQGDAHENPGRGPQLRRMVQEAGAAPGGPHAFPGQPLTTYSDKGDVKRQASQNHCEVILGELKRLMQKAAELEAVVQDWQQVPAAGAASASPASQAPLPGAAGQAPQAAGQLKGGNLFTVVNGFMIKEEQKCLGDNGYDEDYEDSDLWQDHYSALKPVVQGPPSPKAVEATITDCLKNNPDLLEDPAKLQMVQYCFKNYVNINPDLSDLSLTERWERAGQMAREFLGAHPVC
jgi:hypothetical protein